MEVKNLIKVLLLFFLASLAFFSLAINVEVDGTKVDFDVEPRMVQGRTMVPLRAIFVALGVEPEWDGTTQTVTAITDDVALSMKVGNSYAHINGHRAALDVPAMIVKSRTLVPTRFIAESLGANVEWVGSRNTVVIKSKNKQNSYEEEDVINPFEHPQEQTTDFEELIVGDWLYYTERPYFSLYRVHKDGSDKQKIIDNTTSILFAEGEWVYLYISDVEEKPIVFRTNTSGIFLERISDDSIGDSGNIIPYKGWIYYNPKPYRHLYKRRLDGSDEQLLFEGEANTKFIVDDWVYFINSFDGKRLNRIRTDGSNLQSILETHSLDIRLSGDWIYYEKREMGPIGENMINFNSKTYIYRARLDGSDVQLVN